jgi:NAD(P)-dependent dehydrogenase (short-subunit alcohol dehydrogenase family)
MKIDFAGKVVVVTGGGNGIGRAICLAFAQNSAQVACVDSDVGSGTESVRLITDSAGEAIFLEADVTDSASVQRVVEQTLEEYGRIDILVNNAGILGDLAPTTEYDEKTFDRVLRVNVMGVFLGLKFVLPVMQKNGSGVVINMGSTGSHVGAPGACAYTASKHAVLGLTRTAALEVAKDGIRVNAVCPGGTRTRMLDAIVSARTSHADLAFDLMTPNGRCAAPEEIAAAVLFLASDAATHVVGQYLIIDGGRLAM